MSSNSLSFPQTVYIVLRFYCEEQGREDIISWENNGTAFKVNDLQAFERDLLPRCFNTSKYYSFTRALYAHGFTCVRTGRQTGIYSHPKFNRNDPVGPSLISRKKKIKVAALKRTISNTSEAFSNSPMACTWNLQQCQLPSFVDETGTQNGSGSETAFGRLYHAIALQDGGDLVTSLPVEAPPASKEFTGAFHNAGGVGIGTRSYPNPTSLASSKNPTFCHAMSRSKAPVLERQITSNDSLFSPGNTHVALTGMVPSSQRLVKRSSETRESKQSHTAPRSFDIKLSSALSKNNMTEMYYPCSR